MKRTITTHTAARAAWLYYITGYTQYQIADCLGVSRQVVQRLIARASAENLISFQIMHAVSDCLKLASALVLKYNLQFCQVVPSAGLAPAACQKMVTSAAASVMASLLSATPGMTIALGSGRTLRAAIEKMPDLTYFQHHSVSLLGAMTADGTTTRYDVPLCMAQKTGGKYFIVPAPMFADNAHDRDLWCNNRIYKTVTEKARMADMTFLGIGDIAQNCPIFLQGFINREELDRLLELGAVAEVVGHIVDENGMLIKSELKQRLTSIALPQRPVRPTLAFAGGADKYQAIEAVLKGRWINGFITDEESARYLLRGELPERKTL
ncbi:sugar-binding transcriptional regulator [Erwinia pyri]|uniref:Sugar-binding transcriptional regulator n=1 Tax=Erwinia pyri TaxID=3062598 RepID=A0AA50DLQ3_9GAMM|nr:sugar-binding transcriptional regulator [Erwinia sp. DE2]WLS79352.1 sugar-binding transcriptional regulator [Erwinia sp. DE2]